MKRLISKQGKMVGLFFLVLFVHSKSKAQMPDRASIQADSVLKLLNLEDCINLTTGSNGMMAPGIARLGIPALKMTDGPNGPHWTKAPGFPVGICLAATWDTSLMYKAAALMGKCTHVQGRNTLLGPTVNIHRVPVGGRNFESYGEDPWLSSRMAVAFVKGIQNEKVIPTVKHFALNNNEWNRHLSDVYVDERTLREIYLPAFEAAVKEAGALGIMSGYNKVNGYHASEQDFLIGKILKKEWGFKGMVVSDWGSVYSVAGPVNAGLDIEMPNPDFTGRDSIMKYIKSGQITKDQIFEKARRTLYARFAAGLFDKNIPIDTSIQTSVATNNFIRSLAEEGITLLKNNKAILPLRKYTIRSIAVIGPNAATLQSGGGGSSYIDPFYSISPLEGIRNAAGDNIKVSYESGDTLAYEFISPITTNCLLGVDGKTPGLDAEYFSNATLAGEPAFKGVDALINFSWDDLPPAPGMPRKNYSVRWKGFIKPVYTGWYIMKFQTNGDGVVYLDEELAIDRMGRSDATPIMMRRYFEAGKKYALRVEILVPNNGGVAILGWIPPVKKNPYKDRIEKAVALASQSDVAVLCVGWNNLFETEGYDKEEGINLPGFQEELIQAVAAVNPNTIVVINSGTPVFMESWAQKVNGIILAYYPGHEGGNALASLLFGDKNPSGKLPFTFIADSSQAPGFKNYMNVNPKIKYEEGLYVGYRYIDKNNLRPTYPFGFGLSYTTFAITGAKAMPLGSNTYAVNVSVKNTGDRAGEEVVQLYVRANKPTVDKPVKELKAFAKVMLAPGETKQVMMYLPQRAFMFYNTIKNNWETDPGKYSLLIGNSSQNTQQVVTVDIKKSF